MDTKQLKVKAHKFCKGMTDKDMITLRGCINLERKKLANKNNGKTFICPITAKILNKSSGKKIIMSHKITRTYTETSWLYLSRLAFNKINQ